MTNPLTEKTSLPKFTAIKAEHIVPAVEAQLEANRKHLAELLEQQLEPSWESLVEPLCVQDNVLSNLWSPVSHLNSVDSQPEFREQYEACLPLLTDYAAEVGQNQALYNAYLALDKADNLTARQKKIVSDALLDFRLAGVALAEQDQARYRELKKELSQLSSDFSNHVLDATTAWSMHIDNVAQLEGIPESTLADLRTKAKAEQKSGYLLDLQFPTYLAVMTYAEDRSLRETMYHAYSQRASELADKPEWDNGPLINDILKRRHELATLLGFDSYAHYSTATKMAENPEQVVAFLEQLAKPSLQAAQDEFSSLQQFAKQRDGLEDLQAWDVSYYSELLRQRDYDIAQEELRPYFPMPQVLDTLYDITHQLFGVTIKRRHDVDVWHQDVQFFEIFDVNDSLRASFYLDPYARKGKRGGAWMDSCRDRFAMGSVSQKPTAYLTCNFAGPTQDRPALLTHDEVLTLFHEFGHGLHHMLTEIDDLPVSGINGVEWDAVELPSQLLENYAYYMPSLKQMARHYQTGEVLADDVIERLIDARKFQAGMLMVRQLEFALFDFLIHLRFDPDIDGQWQSILDEVRTQVSVVPVPETNRFANSFSHIFAGGYAAGYYSYKWAEVLSADVWDFFEEHGPLEASTGKHYHREILGQGGSKPAMELFKAFRGREPEVEPLLKQQGIAA
jgi:oligopeptidase A